MERERERERDFAQSFPVTAGPPGPKHTVADTCTEGSFGRSPLCKGTCANKFGPVNTGPAKERALAWRSLSLSLSQKPGQKVASHGSPVHKSHLKGSVAASFSARRSSRGQQPKRHLNNLRLGCVPLRLAHRSDVQGHAPHTKESRPLEV